MEKRKLWMVLGITVVVAGLYWFFSSSTGKATVEAIDHTAEAVTGKQAVDQSLGVQEDVRNISRQQTERLQGMGMDTGSEGR